MNETFENARSVTFVTSRWNLYITVVDAAGEEKKFVASADSGLTYGDGIWVGTRFEFDEELTRF